MSITFVQYVLTKCLRVKRNLTIRLIEYTGEPLSTRAYFMISFDKALKTEQELFLMLLQNVEDK